jgi:hypothetical protein
MYPRTACLVYRVLFTAMSGVGATLIYPRSASLFLFIALAPFGEWVGVRDNAVKDFFRLIVEPGRPSRVTCRFLSI